jgi:hypothetical protein
VQRREFPEAAYRYQRRTLVTLGVALPLIAGYLVILMLNLEPWTEWIEAHFRPVGAEIVKGLILLPAIVILFTCLGVAERVTRRDGRLACPHCRKRLEYMASLVIASGNCPYCGVVEGSGRA